MAQVGQAAQADNVFYRQIVVAVQGTGLRQFFPSGDPLHQLAAGRVAHGDDAVHVQLVPGRVLPQAVERRVHVFVGAGVAAARLVHPAVLHIPHGDALRDEGAGHVAHLLDAAEGHRPAAAMHEHDDGERSLAFGLEQLRVLRRRGAIGDLRRGRWAVQGQVVVQAHGGGDGAVGRGEQGGGDQGGRQGGRHAGIRLRREQHFSIGPHGGGDQAMHCFPPAGGLPHGIFRASVFPIWTRCKQTTSFHCWTPSIVRWAASRQAPAWPMHWSICCWRCKRWPTAAHMAASC